MSASMVLRTFERLVSDLREVEARFMFRGPANRNDTDVVAALSMRNRHYLISQETESQEAPLSVRYSHILRGQRKSVENSPSIREV